MYVEILSMGLVAFIGNFVNLYVCILSVIDKEFEFVLSLSTADF